MNSKHPFPRELTLLALAVTAATVFQVSVAAPRDASPIVRHCEGANYRIRLSTSGPKSQVALTECGALLFSPNGAHWRRADTIVNTFFRDVTYAAGRFVAVGGSYLSPSGAILTSVDGEHWTIERCGMKIVLRSVAYGEGLFVAVGDGGTILTSRDRGTWSTQRSPVHGVFRNVSYCDGAFMALGEEGI